MILKTRKKMKNDKLKLEKYKNAVLSGIAPYDAMMTFLKDASQLAMEYARITEASMISAEEYERIFMERIKLNIWILK